MSKIIEETVKNLNAHGFVAKKVSENDIVSAISEIASKTDVIGTGGSQTLKQLDIPIKLAELGYTVLNEATCDISWEEICEKSRTADCYLTSSNAVSASGELVNIDGRGNRVANMIYGVPKVVVIVGSNKICKDLPSAMWRAKNIAAPKNCVRLNKKTPCVVTGKCEDCNSPERICRSTVIHTNPNSKTKTYVFIIDGEYGF